MINSKKVKVLLLIVNVLTLVFLLVSITAEPIVNGYAVYKQVKKLNQSIEDYTRSIDDLRNELILANDNLTACFSKNQKILAGLQLANSEAIECQEESNDNKREIITLKTDCETENKNLRDEIETKSNELNTLKSRHDNLTRNTANNICCKAKIDNLNINYYTVSGDRIICSEGGTLKFSCPSLS